MASDEQTNVNTGGFSLPTEVKVTELDSLKERAKVMGIQHSPNIGVDSLKQKIADFQEGKSKKVVDDDQEEKDGDAVVETQNQKRLRMMNEARKLVRCRIYNMNPSKADLRGEIISIGNRNIGTIRRMVPFGEDTDGGTHIEHIIYQHLKRRRFQSVTPRKVKGEIKVETRMVPEYNIELLPPLTEEELKQLADKQSAAERLGA